MNKPARIAIEATAWQNQRGYGRHARALLTALVRLDDQHLYTFVVDMPQLLAGGEAASFPVGVEICYAMSKRPTVQAASARGSRSLADMWRMSRALSNPAFDLVLFPTIYSFVPVFSRARKIVFIHDVIADRYSHYTFPTRKARFFWRAKVWAGIKQADILVTVSEYSRQKIAGHFHLPLQKILVVGEAADPIFRTLEAPTLSHGLGAVGIPERGRLVIYVGGFGPHKNLPMLIDAFSDLASRPGNEDIYLVLVGEKQEAFYSEITKLEAQAHASPAHDRIIFTGFLPDEELVVLLNLATVLVLPSFMEGFGLPAIEAAACGCPVIATRESPLPEILGEAGIYIDPNQPGQLVSALEMVVGSQGEQRPHEHHLAWQQRQKMRQAGIQAASHLTWEAAAQQLKSIIDQALRKVA